MLDFKLSNGKLTGFSQQETPVGVIKVDKVYKFGLINGTQKLWLLRGIGGIMHASYKFDLNSKEEDF